MKKTLSIFSVILAMVLLVGILPAPVSAADVEVCSTHNGTIEKYPIYSNFQDPISKRAKENNSQVYVWLKDIGYQVSGVMVQAVGMNSGTSYTNCTMWEGSPVTEVVVYEGTEYGIDNTIHKKHDYASLRLRCHAYIIQDIINVGVWSADSSKTYPEAPFSN